MGMGYAAALSVVIEEKDVEKVVPTEWKALSAFMEEKEISLTELAAAIDYDDLLDNLSEADNAEIETLLHNLRDAFVQKTQIELTLHYHNNEDEGSRYDEVSGGFFALAFTDVFEHTPVANRLLNNGVEFELKQWVVFA